MLFISCIVFVIIHVHQLLHVTELKVVHKHYMPSSGKFKYKGVYSTNILISYLGH